MYFIFILSLFLPSQVRAEFVGMHCHLKMIKKSINNSDSSNYGIGINGSPFARVHESRSSGEEVSQIVVSRGNSASLQVQTTVTLSSGAIQGNVVLQPQVRVLTSNVFLTCRGGDPSMYNIKISLNSETSSLSTEISIAKGSRVSLGSIVSDLNNKSKDLSLNNGIAVTATEGTKQYEYWLEVD